MIPAPRRRRRTPFRTASGCLLAIIGIALFASAMELFWTRVDERRFPWAYARPGRPTLTGTWVGAFTSGSGARRGVYLDIRLEPLDYPGSGSRAHGRGMWRRPQSSKLEGEARLCGAAGERRLTFSGNNEDDAASRFYLQFSSADNPPVNGLAPSHVRGRWDGRDSLAIEADLYLRQGASAISSTDDPDTGRPATGGMRRGGEAEFRALCARLR